MGLLEFGKIGLLVWLIAQAILSGFFTLCLVSYALGHLWEAGAH